MKSLKIVLTILVCVMIMLCGYFYYPKTVQSDLTIKTDLNEITYHIEIANTPYLRAKGLMYRKSMPKNHGMLFIFEEPQIIPMWMKNTHIPLDMLFVDKNGIIRHIHENAKPFDETIISSVVPVTFVIELNAGQVKEKNIQITNQVIGL